MFRFPQRKTRLVAYFAITVWLMAFIGCASHKRSSGSAAAFKGSDGVGESEPQVESKKSRPLPPVLVPSRTRSYDYVATKTPEPEEWVYQKNAPKQPPLSMFEESILLGQARAKLKQLSDGANVQTVKVRNRTAHVGVNHAVNSASARRIGETLLNQTRLEEVRIKPL